MLTEPHFRIMYFYPDCSTDPIKYNSGFIISDIMITQAFTNTSISYLMSLEGLLVHQKMQLNAKL